MLPEPEEGADAPDVDDVAEPIEADETDELAAEADEGEEVEDETGEGAEEVAPPPPVGKGRSPATIAVQEAKRVGKEAKERADRLEAELNNIRQERQGRTTAEQQAEERARLELMSPDEKSDYLRSKDRQEFSNALGQLRFEQADGKDQSRFDNVCARKPHFAAIADEVETELAKMRRNGANAPRETIALYLIGKKADERASKGAKTKQASKGAGRVQSQRVAAPSGRSDVKGADQRRGGSEAAARRSRLDGQTI